LRAPNRQLLKSPAVAVYALIRAKQEGFRDRPGRTIAIKPVA
jgi:hypothetical protein